MQQSKNYYQYILSFNYAFLQLNTLNCYKLQIQYVCLRLRDLNTNIKL